MLKLWRTNREQWGSLERSAWAFSRPVRHKELEFGVIHTLTVVVDPILAYQENEN